MFILLPQGFRISFRSMLFHHNFKLLVCPISNRKYHVDMFTWHNSTQTKFNTLNRLIFCPCHLDFDRNFSKKKKGSRKQDQSEELESDEEDEDTEETDANEFNIVSKYLGSLRMDSVIKCGLGSSARKIEKEFYASKIRLNGVRVIKKATMVALGQELDLIKSVSPDNPKFLIVDRIVIKSVGRVNASGNIPVVLQVLKALAVENYEDPWKPSDSIEED